MSEEKNPITLAEAIEAEKEDLLLQFREEKEKIESYVFNVSILVNEALRRGEGKDLESILDDLCAKIESEEKLNPSDLSPELQQYVASIRRFIRMRILTGDVHLGPIPIPETIDPPYPIILAQSDEQK